MAQANLFRGTDANGNTASVDVVYDPSTLRISAVVIVNAGGVPLVINAVNNSNGNTFSATTSAQGTFNVPNNRTILYDLRNADGTRNLNAQFSISINFG